MDEIIDVMVDLETLAINTNAAIVSIGAVAMNFKTNQLIPNTFYERIDIGSSFASGGMVDSDTIKWWLQQPDESRNEISYGISDMKEVLVKFCMWINGKEIRLWGNGAGFDPVILRNTYKRLNLQAPWEFRNDRCYRTMKNIHADVSFPEFMGVKHNALDDAKFQARHLIKIMRKVRHEKQNA